MTSPDYKLFSSHLEIYERELEAIFSATQDLPARLSAGPKCVVPEKSYFICFINRSGSNLLAEALTKTKRMGRPGEMFNPEPVLNTCTANGLRSMAEYIDWQIGKHTVGGVFGAKVGLHQLAYLAKHNLLAEKFPKPHFVYVTRRNLVLQAVSLDLAWQTGAWTSKLAHARQPEFSQEGIARSLRSIAENQAGFEAFFSVHRIEPLRLSYELIESRPEQALRRVCRLVGIERPMRITLPRTTLQRQRTELNDQWAEQFMAAYAQAFPEPPVPWRPPQRRQIKPAGVERAANKARRSGTAHSD